MRFSQPASLRKSLPAILRAILIAALVPALAWTAFAQSQTSQTSQTPPAKPPQPRKQAPARSSSQPAATQPPAAGSPAAKPGTRPGDAKPHAGKPGDAGEANGPDTGNIDEILQGEEEVLSGSGFSYDPGNRRDPFKSLLAKSDAPTFRGPRPEGVPGLLIEEIDLTGIFRTSRGFVAQVVASNQKKSYLLKEGDQLYDGDVVSINKNEVVFKQIVQDPTALKPFREVVKSLSRS
jgi:hypothetical protein